MTAKDMRCDICGSPDFVGVAAVPGFPLSLAWCKHCLGRGAMPLFTAEVTLSDDAEDGRVLTLAETKEKWGLDAMLEIAAEWFLDSEFWVPPPNGHEGPGRYMTLREYLTRL